MTDLRLTEAAKIVHMSAESLRRKAAAGDIPGAKPGAYWIFKQTELEQWLYNQRNTPKQEQPPPRNQYQRRARKQYPKLPDI